MPCEKSFGQDLLDQQDIARSIINQYEIEHQTRPYKIDSTSL